MAHEHAEDTITPAKGKTDELEGLHGHDGDENGPWWRSGKAKLTLACGIALGLAFVLSKLMPQTEPWGFIVAMLVGMIPIARRALIGLSKGFPFSIEMLIEVPLDC